MYSYCNYGFPFILIVLNYNIDVKMDNGFETLKLHRKFATQNISVLYLSSSA